MTKKKKEKKTNYFIIFIFIIFLCFLYARYIGTKGLIVKEYGIINNNLPESFTGFKMVHFSDIHYRSEKDIDIIKNVVTKINELKPDVIVFTGDLIDKTYKPTEEEINNISKELNNLKANINMFSVRGNEDINKYYDSIITKTNFIELNNLNKFVYYESNIPILFIGLDDYIKSEQNIETAFNYEDNNYYKILLAHEPDSYNNIKNYNINLMLSGHSLNGQVRFPFIGGIIKPNGAKTYYDEKYIINNTEMYISGGIGEIKYPIRFLNKPSINFYRFYNN